MEQNIKNLAAATLLQAAKDYCEGDAKRRKAILKQLRSAWMQELTQFNAPNSLVVAGRLETNHEEIYLRLKRDSQDI